MDQEFLSRALRQCAAGTAPDAGAQVIRVALVAWLLLALTACSSPTPVVVDATDARADAPMEDDAAPPAVDGNITPPVTPDSGDETPCVQLPADTLPIGDDCFAFELESRCAPY